MERASDSCWLCERPLGARVEWHHPVPKAKGGRETVPLHPICHRAIHAHFSNGQLARMGRDQAALRGDPALAAFLCWVAGKPADFHAPTRKPRR
ncbi:HNH endonuclease [Sphingobium sp. B8D3A]|uniref:HNH endonuclease n=1 Tax=unclassified Sphingobium TaxID=2611147 RepID=UPI0039B5D710